MGDVSLHIDQRAFADQLDWLLEGRRIVSLTEALAQPAAQPAGPDGTWIVITFDDAYRGTMTAGLEELARRDLPGTVFVPPGLLGSEGFWWDRLSPPGGRALDPDVRIQALEALQARTGAVVEWAEREGLDLQDLPAHARPVSEDELLADCLPPAVTFGAHSWSHPNLASLDGDALRSELERSRDWLRRRTERYRDWLAYPYGISSSTVESAAAETFEGALLVAGGPAVLRGGRVGPAQRIPRINVPRGLSLDGLALRIGGLVGT